MFSRTSKGAFICLRCQSRLLRQSLLYPISNNAWPFPTARRLQSTAAVRIEEEEDEYEDHVVPQEIPQPPDPRDRRRHNSKIWRPPPIAELGVSSLGKPAEVLVLHHRDRHIPQVPTDDNGEHEPRLAQSLEAEREPLSPEQVKENIDQVIAPFHDQSGFPDHARRPKLWQALSKGFTAAQLAGYVRDGIGSTQVVKNQNEMKNRQAMENPDVKASRKKKIAIKLILEEWGFADRVAGKKEMALVAVKLPKYKFRALIAQRYHTFKDVAHKFCVTVQVYDDKYSLLLKGEKDSVAAAKHALESWGKEILSINIPIGKKTRLLTGREDYKYEEDLLKHISRPRHVYIDHNIKKVNSNVRIHYHHRDVKNAMEARRDLLIAAHDARQESLVPTLRTWREFGISTWPPFKQSSASTERPAWLIPINLSDGVTWLEKQKSWGRLGYLRSESVSEQSESSHRPQDNTPPGSHSREILKFLQQSPLATQLSDDAKRFRQDYHVLFGKALSRRDVKLGLLSALQIMPQHDSSFSRPMMLSEIPLFTQFLTACKNQTASSKATRADPGIPIPGQKFVYRLYLIPRYEEPYFPPIEIYLTGQDAMLGLKQPLHHRQPRGPLPLPSPAQLRGGRRLRQTDQARLLLRE